MRFTPQFLDEIRARLPVSQVVARKVALKKAGREYKGLSPFKMEKSPSFFVNDQKGFYHCFASGAHGDIFRFVMETEGLSFPEVVERLAAEAGLQMPKPEARRANLPVGWAEPAFDRLQVEDYDWLTAGDTARRRTAYAELAYRLGYSAADQDYLAGFVPAATDGAFWRRIDAGIDEAQRRGAHEIFVWALPQICRDGFVRLPLAGEEDPM